MTKRVTFKIDQPPVKCRHRNGYLDWSGKKSIPCSEDEFLEAYEHFVKLARWCVSWGKPMELEEIKIFLNKFTGFYFPGQEYHLCIKKYIHTPKIDEYTEKINEQKLMATIKEIAGMGYIINFDLISDLVRNSFAVKRENI